MVLLKVLTRPNAANKNFPYHVRTSQIGIMEQQQSMNGLSGEELIIASHTQLDLDRFPHHAYAPTVRNGGTNNNNNGVYAISNGSVQ